MVIVSVCILSLHKMGVRNIYKQTRTRVEQEKSDIPVPLWWCFPPPEGKKNGFYSIWLLSGPPQPPPHRKNRDIYIWQTISVEHARTCRLTLDIIKKPPVWLHVLKQFLSVGKWMRGDNWLHVYANSVFGVISSSHLCLLGHKQPHTWLLKGMAHNMGFYKQGCTGCCGYRLVFPQNSVQLSDDSK